MQKGIDYIGVGVVFFCHDGKGNVILSRRGKNARDEHGMWDIGGGGIEFGDSAMDTLKKEIKEEYGTDVLEYEFLGYRDDMHREHNGKKIHWLALDFKVLVNPAKVKNCEPHKLDEVKWFTLDTLPVPLHSQMPVFLEKYKGRL